MVKVVVTDPASLDLRQIHDDLLKISFSEEVAGRIVKQIISTLRSLEEFPELGKRAKDNFLGNWDFGTDIRALLSDKYWIIYDDVSAENSVSVLRIVNTRRDMHRIFK